MFPFSTLSPCERSAKYVRSTAAGVENKMSTPVKRKITLELNPNKKVLPKDRPSVFQRLGTKKYQTSLTGGSGPVKLHQQEQDSVSVGGRRFSGNMAGLSDFNCPESVHT